MYLLVFFSPDRSWICYARTLEIYAKISTPVVISYFLPTIKVWGSHENLYTSSMLVFTYKYTKNYWWEIFKFLSHIWGRNQWHLKFKVFFFLRYITRHLFSWRYWIWCPAYSGLTGKNKPYWFSEEPFISWNNLERTFNKFIFLL